MQDANERISISGTYVDYREIFEGLPGQFLILHPDPVFTIVDASDSYLKARFAERDAIVGRSLFDVLPDDRDYGCAKARLRVSLERVARKGRHERMAVQRYDVPAPDGSLHERFWLADNAPVLSPEGRVRYIVHRVEDVTELVDRKHAAGERRRLISESEKQRRIYEAALSNTPDLVYVFDLGHRFTYANEALLEMWGRTREEAIGRNCLQLGYPQWHAEMHDHEIDRVVATKQPIRGEVPFTGTHGRRIYEYIFAPVLGPDGEVVAVAGTTRDVTDRQLAEQAIRERAEALRAADRAKDEFLATLAHELRNPLAPLRNALHLLRVAAGTGRSPAAMIDMMERQVRHLVRLVDDLLEMSRISRGALTLRRERIELADVLRNAVETSRPLIESAGHDLIVERPEDELWLDGDAVRLAQIVANLLNNSARYMDDHGHIRVRAERDGDAAVVSVHDTGIGIEPEAQSRMFEMFSRGSEPVRGDGGLGIGLALSRRLAEMHGGTLTGSSEGAGKGSVFVLRLPQAAPPESGEAEAEPGGQQAPLRPQRILVVDDNGDAADSLAMLLESLGACVEVARSGTDALRKLETFAPRVVFLDIGMPGMNGYQVAQIIRREHRAGAVVLVALTGWGQEQDRQRARQAGFDHHFVKPADIEALQALLASIGGDGRTESS